MYKNNQILVFLVLVALSSAFQIKVLSNPALNKQQLSNKQTLIINSNSKYIYPYQKSVDLFSYSIPELKTGKNFIQIVSSDFVYPLLMINSRNNSQNTYHLVHPYTRQIMEKINQPLFIRPLQKINYLIQEQGFSIMGFLFSGTGLFVVGGILMYLCYKQVMPKLQQAQMAPQRAPNRPRDQ